MFQMFMGSILSNPDIIKYWVVGLIALFVLTTIVKKLFKLALILALVAIAAYYFVPQIMSMLSF